MQKPLFAFGLFLAFATAGTAQHQHNPVEPNIERCQYEQLEAQFRQEDPTYDARRAAIKQERNEWLQKNGTNNQRVVYTIPVVVHVIYRTNAQNISTAQVQSQIDILNEDYRRLNADASNTPMDFQGIAADCEIEFCLATTDPDGNPTTGITRTETTVQNIGSTNSYYRSNQGGQDIWNRNLYLNMWVCEISSGILGFATPPGAPANRDGIVVDHVYFGNTGIVQSPFNLGRTTTHEVGHWLDLAHVWGNGCGGDDGVGDTPNSDSPYYGCPSYPQVSCGTNDQHMNYMDYVNDNCMNMFTTGQKNIMVSTLNTVRSSILTSNGCSAGCPIINMAFDSEYCGESSGEITVTPTGGVPPYTYNWDANAQNQTTQTVSGLPTGTYFVTITDADGCTALQSFTVTGTGDPMSITSATANAIGANCDGGASAIASGGTPPYSYLWSSGATTASAFSLCPGTVSCTVTDAANCQMVITDVVGNQPPVSVDELLESQLNVYPNPSTGAVFLSGLPASGAEIQAMDMSGRVVSAVSVNGQSIGQIDLGGLSDGVYVLVIRAEDQTAFRKVSLVR